MEKEATRWKSKGQKWASLFKEGILSLLYPSRCSHCGVSLDEPHLLCSCCLHEMQLIDVKERCPTCFSTEEVEDLRCINCRLQLPMPQQKAAVFDYYGPAGSLIKLFKYGNMAHLAEGLASFAAIQWLELGWPKPDGIVPVPISFWKKSRRGYNQSTLLACELSKLINVPVFDILVRKGGYAQAQLTSEKRRALDSGAFTLKSASLIEGKHWLLIDDVATTGATLRAASKALARSFPSRIDALTLAEAKKGV